MVCRRTATNASCSGARARVWACTLPVATQASSRRRASSSRRRLRARSSRRNGRWSSTRRRSRPNASRSRRRVGSSWTPRSAQPLRQTRPSECSSTVVQRRRRLARGRARPPLARVRVRAGEDPAQVRPARGVGDQQREVAPVVEVDLGAVDRPQPERPRGDRELHRARDRVVVGQRDRVVAQLQRRRRPARRAATRHPGTRTPNGSAAPRTSSNICSHTGRPTGRDMTLRLTSY